MVNKENDILVSILILTYQHSEYIRQALDSVLMQKVNFNYEIIISDDCSMDGTQEILIDYKRIYPNLIHLNLQKVNLGAIRNLNMTLKRCKGKYIAFLEGDDFWNDANKLQTQIDFLENHPEYSACCHNAEVIGDDIKKCKLYKINHSDIDSLDYYLKTIPTIVSASLTCRNLFGENNYYKYFTKTKFIGDRIIHALLLRHGKIKYLNEKMCTYRFITHGNTSFSSQDKIFGIKDFITSFKVLRSFLPSEYHKAIDEFITKKQIIIIECYWDNHQKKEMFQYICKDLSLKEKINIIVRR